MSISQVPAGWTITRSDERIVVQHASGSFYAAAKEGDSGIAESVLYMLADSLLNATLSPAHVEDGEEVEVVGHLALDEPFNGTEGLEIGEWEFVPDRSAVESMLAVSTGDMIPLMTVAQHERKVAALELKLSTSDYAYDSSMDEIRRLVRELDVLLNGEAGAAQQASLCDLVGQVAGVVRERGAPLLSAQPADGVPEGWKLVPIEPTQAMFDAGRTSATGSSSEKLAMAGYYRAMLAAAPTPPASEQQRAVVMPERREHPSMSMYAGFKEYATAYGEVSGHNACLDEFLRLNPHLAKGEGV